MAEVVQYVEISIFSFRTSFRTEVNYFRQSKECAISGHRAGCRAPGTGQAVGRVGSVPARRLSAAIYGAIRDTRPLWLVHAARCAINRSSHVRATPASAALRDAADCTPSTPTLLVLPDRVPEVCVPDTSQEGKLFALHTCTLSRCTVNYKLLQAWDCPDRTQIIHT